MTKYDKLSRELEDIAEHLHVDDMSEDGVILLYYGEEIDQDLLCSIEDDTLFSYDDKAFIKSISTGKEGDNSYILLHYKCNIGADEKTEEELYEESIDDDEDRKYQLYKESKLED